MRLQQHSYDTLPNGEETTYWSNENDKPSIKAATVQSSPAALDNATAVLFVCHRKMR